MKKYILFALALSLISTLSFAQDRKMDHLLFMLRQTEHINQAIKTIDEIKSASSQLNTGSIAIIVCGEAVTSLTTDEAKHWMQQLSKYENVSLMACGLSLDKFKKTKEELVPGVLYTRNGFIKAFELQKQGYLSVEL